MNVRLAAAPALFAILSACGGGGESTGPDGGTTSFTSFSAIQPGQTVEAVGVSQTENVTQQAGTGTVTSDVVNAADATGSSLRLTSASGAPPAIRGIQFVNPRRSTDWSDGRGSETVTCSTQSCAASGNGALGVLVQPTGGLAWNFQTFGYWLATTGLPANLAGSISGGRQTIGGAVPTTGSALSYSGISGGIYVDPAGALQEHAATVTFVFNPAGTINFSTTNTTIRPWNSSVISAPAALDIAGQFAFIAGTNRFSGAISVGPTIAPTMTGTVNGVFYGPAADEVGGTFSLTSTASGGSVESLTGGFGARQ